MIAIQNTISAAAIKKALKLYNIAVLRCKQNKNGVLITIKNIPGNVEKIEKFFNEFELKNICMNTKPISIQSKYIDFSTMYNFTIK